MPFMSIVCHAALRKCICSAVYLEHGRRSMMEICCENSQWLLAVSYFHKKAPS